MTLTIGELKKFITDLPDSTPVLVDCIQRGEHVYGTDTLDIYYSSGMDGRHLHLTPSAIEVSDDEDF